MYKLTGMYGKIRNAAVSVLLFAMVIAGATGCNTEAKYSTSKVNLEMHIVQKSCGFIEAEFHTNKDAYYYISIEKVREGVDPMQVENQFKTLALDYAYKEYINWRYDLLYNGVKHIPSSQATVCNMATRTIFSQDLTRTQTIGCSLSLSIPRPIRRRENLFSTQCIQMRRASANCISTIG